MSELYRVPESSGWIKDYLKNDDICGIEASRVWDEIGYNTDLLIQIGEMSIREGITLTEAKDACLVAKRMTEPPQTHKLGDVMRDEFGNVRIWDGTKWVVEGPMFSAPFKQ